MHGWLNPETNSRQKFEASLVKSARHICGLVLKCTAVGSLGVAQITNDSSISILFVQLH